LNAIKSSTIKLQPIPHIIVRTASRLWNAEFAQIYNQQNGKYYLDVTSKMGKNLAAPP
jgi:hypothetical protein